MKPISVDVGEALKTFKLTLNVTGLRRMRFRLWLGAKIIRLATAVIGCEGEVLINGESL